MPIAVCFSSTSSLMREDNLIEPDSLSNNNELCVSKIEEEEEEEEEDGEN